MQSSLSANFLADHQNVSRIQSILNTPAAITQGHHCLPPEYHCGLLTWLPAWALTAPPPQYVTHIQLEGACEDLSQHTTPLCSKPSPASHHTKIKGQVRHSPHRPARSSWVPSLPWPSCYAWDGHNSAPGPLNWRFLSLNALPSRCPQGSPSHPIQAFAQTQAKPSLTILFQTVPVLISPCHLPPSNTPHTYLLHCQLSPLGH